MSMLTLKDACSPSCWKSSVVEMAWAPHHSRWYQCAVEGDLRSLPRIHVSEGEHSMLDSQAISLSIRDRMVHPSSHRKLTDR
jgi:hypothetical protein